MVEVYADVVFIINLAMDFFILLIISKIFQRKAGLHRLLAGAFISAALYCAVIFTIDFNVWLNLVSSVCIISAGILASFHPLGRKEFIKILLSAYVVAFAVGGCGTVIYYYTSVSGPIGGALNATAQNFSLKILIAAVCVSYICIKLFTNLLHKLTLRKQAFYRLDLWLDGKKARINGLVDTGNTLIEPISNKGVIVVEHYAIKGILPENVYSMFEAKTEDDLQTVLDVFSSGALQNRLRFIPFSSLGRKNGVLVGFRADKATFLHDTGGDAEALEDVIVGICGFKLSPEGEYCALINPSLIKSML